MCHRGRSRGRRDVLTSPSPPPIPFPHHHFDSLLPRACARRLYESASRFKVGGGGFVGGHAVRYHSSFFFSLRHFTYSLYYGTTSGRSFLFSSHPPIIVSAAASIIGVVTRRLCKKRFVCMERMISFYLSQESLTDNRKDALYLRMWNERRVGRVCATGRNHTMSVITHLLLTKAPRADYW